MTMRRPPLFYSSNPMSNGFSGASRHLSRRRRWLSLLPEESPAEPVQRSRRVQVEGAEPRPDQDVTRAAPVSSLLPQRTWVLALLVGCVLACWGVIVGVGAWLDVQQMDPWRSILGIRSGRLLHFFTTITLLTCAQLSYLILWRRSRSRKDFAGRYRVWFWVGAVCSTFCVACASGTHRHWTGQLAHGLRLIWVDAATVCWMVPATTMWLSAMLLMQSDMPDCTASTAWARASRGLGMLAGASVLLGELVWPAEWVAAINASLGALWTTVFACTLLIHARYVTYVTNEASRTRQHPRRFARVEGRLKAFVQHVTLMASQEWECFRQHRAAARADKLATTAPHGTTIADLDPVALPNRERHVPPASPAQMAAAPLQRMLQHRQATHVITDNGALPVPTPVTQAVNARPLMRPVASARPASPPIQVHPAQSIPAPHFPMDESSRAEADLESGREFDKRSEAIAPGYSQEQWRNLSKKDRKRLRRAETVQ